MKYQLHLFGLYFLFALLLGCATPSERAQKLFQSGQYEQVITRYPNEPVAREARQKLAEQLYQTGDYQRILDSFSDTPSASLAREKLAAALLAQESYQLILDTYPNTPSAIVAREAVAQQLFDDGKLDILIQKFPNSKVGREARESLARQAFNYAADLKDKNQKISALEDILTNPLYAGTSLHKLAQDELARLKGSKK
jgi:hypothetical protein